MVRLPRRAAVALAIAAYNLVQNLVVSRSGYVPANLAVSGGLVAMARWQGCDWDDLGLCPSRLRSGLRLGLGGGALGAAPTLALALHPTTRRFLLDERAASQGPGDIAYHTLVRFPLGTALFEEIAFRGVSYGVWKHQGASDRRAVLASAAMFGVWHVLPTARAISGNPAGRRLDSLAAKSAVVGAGVAMTGLASLGFTWLRKRSGSLGAPWLAHSVINGVWYLAGVVAWRLTGSER